MPKEAVADLLTRRRLFCCSSQQGQTQMSERMIYYLAAPIARRDDGAILTDDAVECLSAEAAIRRAEQMSRQPHYIGAWAFSHTGYPAADRFGNAKVLKRFGRF